MIKILNLKSMARLLNCSGRNRYNQIRYISIKKTRSQHVMKYLPISLKHTFQQQENISYRMYFIFMCATIYKIIVNIYVAMEIFSCTSAFQAAFLNI